MRWKRLGPLLAAGIVLAAGAVFFAPGPGPQPQRANPSSDGVRHVLTSGTFGGDWDQARAGRPWRLLVWREDASVCWQVVPEGRYRNEGRTCSRNPRPRALRRETVRTWTSSYTGSRDPDEYLFVAGGSGPRVARLSFYGDSGTSSEVPLRAAPLEMETPYRYFAAVLPRFDHARLVAYSPTGRVVATIRLCGVACRGPRDVEDHTDVFAFEDAPTTIRSAAAAFAIAAAGDAGLIDRLGTSWAYRGISGKGRWSATFEAVECPPDADRCAPRGRTGTINVARVGGALVVTGVGGDIPGGRSGALLAYSEPLVLDRPEWRVVGESLTRLATDEWRIAFSLVWTGNPGTPWDYGSMCRPTVYDRRGRMLYRGPDVAFEVRDRPIYRLDGHVVRIETKGSPARLTVECDPPRAGFTKEE